MEKVSFMKLVPSAKKAGDHWSIGSLTYDQSCVKSVAGLTTELKWLGWDRAGPQDFSIKTYRTNGIHNLNIILWLSIVLNMVTISLSLLLLVIYLPL